VANAVGPLAAIWGIHEAASVDSTVEVPLWILLLGGVGIAVGLLTYGYNVILTMGLKLTKITPSRGFSISMAASIVVIIGTNLGIPLSTTHCQVGATVGVGVCEIGGRKSVAKGVNWKMMAKVGAMWVATLFFAAIVTSSVFVFLSSVYHPISEPLHCGPIKDVLASVPNSGVDVSKQHMKDLFKKMDTDNDEILTGTELKSQGMDKTLKGDKTVEKYGRRRRRTPKEMTEEDFLKFTCVYSDKLENMHYNKCEPRCKNGDFRANKDLSCKFNSARSDASGNFMLATKYSGFSACVAK